MSEMNEKLEKELADEREKIRLNSLKVLKFLGYDKDASKLTQEQIDARVELLMEQKKNAEIENTKNAKTNKPAFFSGIDEERENIAAVENAKPSELDLAEFGEGYDALTALIPQLRNNAQVGHMESLADREDIRIVRLPTSIKLNDSTTIIKRVVL